MTGNVLQTIKNMLVGSMDSEDDSFDGELTTWINSAIMKLNQLGVNLRRNLDESTRYLTFEDIFEPADCNNAFIPEYIALYVKKTWDPPSNASAASALTDRLKGLEFEINTETLRGDKW